MRFSIEKIEKVKIFHAIRDGLVMVLPVLLIGCFALVLQSLPINGYQNLLHTTLANTLLPFLDSIYKATFGLFSVYLLITISCNYSINWAKEVNFPLAGPIIALICFCVTVGLGNDYFDISLFGVKGTFSAIICALISTRIFIAFQKSFKRKAAFFADGTDFMFNNALDVIVPSTLTISLFVIVNLLFVKIFQVSGFHEFATNITLKVFSFVENPVLISILYIILSTFLWFFGIHGSNVLEDIASQYFVSASDAFLSGTSEICTKTFLDVFVLMGGCGTTLCLLIAILLFSKRRCNLSLSRMAFVPMIFNINEIMLFGFPIIYNPHLFIPFLLTPLVCFAISYLAVYLGLVPIPLLGVNWTTPVFFSGYLVTHSIRGVVLQFVNLLVGTLIYMPFVKMYDKRMESQSRLYLKELVRVLQESEISTVPVVLTEIRSEIGALAKNLALDLEQAIEKKDFELYYQPQYNNKNMCVGAEALLRWKHPIYGKMHPPLVIKLAEEMNLLKEFEKMIVEKVIEESSKMADCLGKGGKVSVNVTASTLQSEGFEDFLRTAIQNVDISKIDICLEITEQFALSFDAKVEKLLASIRKMGYKLAIDDFSMGHTSIKYLQTNQFDVVKLDGEIVRSMLVSPHAKEIISSIVYLSKSLNFSVVAEYVETEEQKSALEEIGCYSYQGYLFGEAVPLNYLAAKIRTERRETE